VRRQVEAESRVPSQPRTASVCGAADAVSGRRQVRLRAASTEDVSSEKYL